MDLTNCSNLGRNLQTGSDVGENIFVILVVCSGFLLFALLIGNMQVSMSFCSYLLIYFHMLELNHNMNSYFYELWLSSNRYFYSPELSD